MRDKTIELLSAKYMVLLEPENELDVNRPTETHEIDCTEFIQSHINNNKEKGIENNNLKRYIKKFLEIQSELPKEKQNILKYWACCYAVAC